MHTDIVVQGKPKTRDAMRAPVKAAYTWRRIDWDISILFTCYKKCTDMRCNSAWKELCHDLHIGILGAGMLLPKTS